MKRSIVRRAGVRGFSLIELMIALVLGLIVSGAAIGLFVSNGVTFRATSSLSRMQEISRMAFEFMATDLRKAGGNACSRGIPIANTLNTPTANWYTDWSAPVKGYDDGDLADSADGTDAIDLHSAEDTGVSVVSHVATSANFHVNSADHGFEVGDILIVCDYKQAAVFQMTGPASSGGGNARVVVHNTGGSTSPGNCTKGLGYKPVMDCSTNGTPYTYGANSVLVKAYAARWYVADNGRGGRSLYRLTLRDPAAPEEITDGVEDMQLSYLVDGASDYVDASDVAAADWASVLAVRVTLTLVGKDRVGSDGDVLHRTMSHTVTLRNRNE